jgi:hypothetical protein
MTVLEHLESPAAHRSLQQFETAKVAMGPSFELPVQGGAGLITAKTQWPDYAENACRPSWPSLA